jgi:hypothetical protein
VFLVTGSATSAAYFAHPYLLNTAAHVLNLDFRDSVTAFQTSFFSFLSLVFAIFSGNTMAFLYDVRALGPGRPPRTARVRLGRARRALDACVRGSPGWAR